MSKKLIAIVLFATMLFALVPVVNAAADFTHVEIEALQSNSDVAWDKASFGAFKNDETTGTVNHNGLKPIADATVTFTITGNYTKLNTAVKGDFLSGKGPIYRVSLKFDSEAADTVTVNGETVTVSGGFYRLAFIGERGGNEQTYTVVVKKGASTIERKFKVVFKDSSSSQKTVKNLQIQPSAKPLYTGDYATAVMGNVLFIDYATDLNLIASVTNITNQRTNTIGLKFYNDGTIIPAEGEMARFIVDKDHTKISKETTLDGQYKDGGFFPVSDTALKVTTVKPEIKDAVKSIAHGGALEFDKDGATVAFFINPSIGNFKARIEGRNYLYQSDSYNISWRAVPRNQITNIAVVGGKNITLAIGEEKTIEINSSTATTMNNYRLVDTGFNKIIYIDGLKIKGISVGETIVQVQVYTLNNDGSDYGYRTIDVLNIKVTDGTTPPVIGNTYRVIARNLNVRSGPGTTYAKAGTLKQNTVVEVVEILNGWAKLSNGTYASAQYLVAVNSAGVAGTYSVSASSLVVRNAPSGTKVGSLPRNSQVAVSEITGGWAKIASGVYAGMYVSAMYLK